MCGIVGAMALGKLGSRQEKLRQESMVFLTTELLQLTQARGTDATGTSLLFDDGNFVGLKMGVSSPEFISRFGGTKTDFEGFIKLWRENEHPGKTYLGHCRKTSVGSSKDNNNNHPIKVGNIVGIHNGTLTNHDVIFEKLGCKRDGDVDSEAIIRMLHFYTRKGTDPFTTEMLKEVCLRLNGSYSVIAYNGDNPDQIATFRDGRPAFAALVRPLNLLLMASEESYIKQVLYRYNKQSKIYLSKIKFPILTKADIDYKTMPDDTCAVFDLSNKVNKDTIVEDLVETAKVARLDKIWKKATTYSRSTTTTHNRNIHGAGNVNKNTAANQSAAQKEDKDKEDKPHFSEDTKEVKGKVWNKELSEFKDVDDDQEEKAKKIKSIEVAPNGSLVHLEAEEKDDETTEVKDEIIEAKPINKDDVNLKEVPKEEVNKLMGNTAGIEDDPVEYEGEISVINPSTGDVQEKPKGVTVEVSTNVNPAAMEAAVKAAAVQPKFESDEEVLGELDIDDKGQLKNLQLFALANRLNKILFKRGYYKGFVRAAEGDTKLSKAEERIRTLKTVAKIFMKSFRATSHNDKWKQDHMMEASEDEGDLTIEGLNKVFSSGDLRSFPELRYLRDKCSKFKRQLYNK